MQATGVMRSMFELAFSDEDYRRSGADVNFQDSKGKTALHYGLKNGLDPSLLRFLVRSGASPDINDRGGISARQQAFRKREKSLLAALIE